MSSTNEKQTQHPEAPKPSAVSAAVSPPADNPATVTPVAAADNTAATVSDNAPPQSDLLRKINETLGLSFFEQEHFKINRMND